MIKLPGSIKTPKSRATSHLAMCAQSTVYPDNPVCHSHPFELVNALNVPVVLTD